MIRKALFLSIVVAAVFLGCTKSDVSSAPTSGVAEDFSLRDLNGKKVTLSEFRGKPVLIDFWATWCPPCRESIPGIEKLYKAYSGKGLVVLGVSLDQGDWDSVKAFGSAQGITYPLLKGDEDVAVKYQVRTIPMLVIVSKDGKILKRFFGVNDDDELEKEIKAVL